MAVCKFCRVDVLVFEHETGNEFVGFIDTPLNLREAVELVLHRVEIHFVCIAHEVAFCRCAAVIGAHLVRVAVIPVMLVVVIVQAVSEYGEERDIVAEIIFIDEVGEEFAAVARNKFKRENRYKSWTASSS